MDKELLENWNKKTDCFSKYKNISSKLIFRKEGIKQPVFTISIITYKRNNLLMNALNSCLCQLTDKTFAVTIVDNDPENTLSDELICSLNKFDDISYYKNSSNIGMFGNWNRSIELSLTEWVCVLHDDDLLKNNYVEIMLQFLNKNSSYAAIGNNRGVLDLRENSKLIEKELRKGFHPSTMLKFIQVKNSGIKRISNIDMLYFRTIEPCAVTFSKSKIIEIGGFDERWGSVADTMCFYKLNYHFGICKLNQELSLYGIGVNESLKIETKLEFIKTPFYMIEQFEKEFKPTIYTRMSYYSQRLLLNTKRIWPDGFEKSGLTIDNRTSRFKYLIYLKYFIDTIYFELK